MHAQVHHDFTASGANMSTQIIEIPAGFTSECQPCDAGIIKSFKS